LQDVKQQKHSNWFGPSVECEFICAMKVLLLHSGDLPWRGPWAGTHWDLIIDLAFAGSRTYEEWSRHCGGTPVRTIHEFAGDGQSYASIQGILDMGRDRLVDRMGVDWWEVLAVVNYHELQRLWLLQCLSHDLGPEATYYASREHVFTRLLGTITGTPIHSFEAAPSRWQALGRSLSSAMKLSPTSIVEIAFDKWDPDYSVRRHWNRWQRADVESPAVLLPSAYSNVTRLLLQYAADVPGRNFLLAATRQSGTAKQLPANVRQTALSAYAEPAGGWEQEEKELADKWTEFETTALEESQVLRWSRDSGVWKSFPNHLRTGLRLRNAWQSLLTKEPIAGVLCADDLNYYTRLPLILAANMGLASVYCYHGALDGGLLFKKAYAGRYLVKSEMEKDYLLRCSHIEPNLVQMGAPGSHSPRPARIKTEGTGDIVFFSQPYEVLAGRPAEIYRDILPQLCAIARRTGRRMIVKLHPFESQRARKKLLQSVLTTEEMSQVKVAADSSLDAVLNSAWCGIGVDSSVAMECCAAGIPYFLCGWVDYSGFGYSRQLAQFGAGHMLEDCSQLARIPEMIANWSPSKGQQFCAPIDSDLLEKVLFHTYEAQLNPCVC
jgi:hypothetical protein